MTELRGSFIKFVDACSEEFEDGEIGLRGCIEKGMIELGCDEDDAYDISFSLSIKYWNLLYRLEG